MERQNPNRSLADKDGGKEVEGGHPSTWLHARRRGRFRYDAPQLSLDFLGDTK